MAEQDMQAIPAAAAKAGLSADTCRLIRASYGLGGITKRELAGWYGVDMKVVEAVLHGIRAAGATRAGGRGYREAYNPRTGKAFFQKH